MIRRAFAFSVLQRYSELVIQVGLMIVLARLIPPDEFGVFVAGAAVLALAQVVGEFGQPDYLIQERELTRERRAAALGLSVAVSAACALAMGGAVLLLPESVIDPRLGDVLIVLALGLLVRPFVIAITALLARELRFGPVCLIGLARTATLAAVSILLAARGLGAMSLAVGTVAAEVAALGLALGAAGRAGRTLPRLGGWGGIVRFGALRTGISGLTRVGEAGTMLATSQLLGFAAAGLLSRGQRIGGLFDEALLQAVKPVILPALAHHRRAEGDLKEAYLLKAACISALAWPCFGFTALFAEPIVGLLLGPAWMGVVPIVIILCLGGVCTPLTNLNAKFYIALGMLPVFLLRQSILQPVKLLLVAAGALISLELVAAALAGEQLLKAALDLPPLKRRLNYAARELAERTAGSLIVTATSLGPVIGLLAVFGIPEENDVAFLFAGAAIAALGWLAGILATRHPLAGELLGALRATRTWLRPVRPSTATPPVDG